MKNLGSPQVAGTKLVGRGETAIKVKVLKISKLNKMASFDDGSCFDVLA